MEDIFSKIKIVPLKKVFVHEQIVKKWARNLSSYMEQSGIQKNPIIVYKTAGKYIVLDGMHRVEAMKIIGCHDIMVYMVDYFKDSIELHNWYGIVFGDISPVDILNRIVGRKSFVIKKEKKDYDASEMIRNRKILLAVRDRKNNLYTVSLRKGFKINEDRFLTIATSLIERLESIVDSMDYRIVYVPNVTGERDFKTSSGNLLIYRPLFTKEEVIHRTLTGKTFPRKSTRHIIPGRPLRVDLNITLLKENINLKIKNKLLYAHLMWCFESNRMRYYPEPVYIFSD